MPQFRYVAVEDAETIEGRMEATNKAAVVARLQASGQVPIRVDEVGSGISLNMDLGAVFGERRMPGRQLALLTSQLATLLHAGLAIDEALLILQEMVDRERDRQLLKQLLEKVSGGATLSDAMAEHKAVFPDFYISMIRAGEAGASLEAVLERLAEYLERSQAAREHVTSALLYPIIVAVTCVVSICVLFVFVVPRFRPLFEQAGDKLPYSAAMLLVVSDFFQAYWWVAVALPVVIGFIIWRQLKQPETRRRLDGWVLKLPLFGDLVTKTEVVRFARTLGTLLKNGVSLLTALSITRETIGNGVFVEAITAVINRVKTGKGLAEPLAQTKVFPTLAVHLVRVGEESGRQDEMLLKIAEIFEGESRRTVDRLLSLLGPVITVGMGLVVAGVIGSILSAVLSVYDFAI